LAALLGLFVLLDNTSLFIDKISSLLFPTPTGPTGIKSSAAITDKEILAAQKGWGDALIKLSKTYETEGYEAAKTLAAAVIDSAYGYKYGPVLFKPTLAGGSQTFRPTKEGALAYFVGGFPAYPNDGGFGIKGWRKVKFVNSAIWKQGNIGVVMGNVHFTNKDGSITTVDKTFGYFKAPDGSVVIILHHSSLPYSK
jgi:hypothetical protein